MIHLIVMLHINLSQGEILTLHRKLQSHNSKVLSSHKENSGDLSSSPESGPCVYACICAHCYIHNMWDHSYTYAGRGNDTQETCIQLLPAY